MIQRSAQSTFRMILLKSRHHTAQVLQALQNLNECEILIVGKDKASACSDSLWIFSPLVRSVIDSLKNIEEHMIIFPDFSSEDIKTALDVIKGNGLKDLAFNSTTKILLETLGIDLKNIFVSAKPVKTETIPIEKIKTEDIDISEDEEDDKLEVTLSLGSHQG